MTSLLPVGVSTCTVNFGQAISFLGAGAAINVTLSAVIADVSSNIVEATIVHAATGVALYSGDDALVTSANGDPITFAVPHVDQAGFVDAAGNAVTFWAYQLKGTIAFGKKKVSVSKTFQPVVGQATLDLDLIPDGAAEVAVMAPIPAVTSVGGQTGVVTADQLAAALAAKFVPKWKATTAYALGDTVLAPDGSIVKAKAAFTSGASYSAANWTSAATYAGTQAQTELSATFVSLTGTLDGGAP